jgi:hypothetical protein
VTDLDRRDHWLWRLDARAWLLAAEVELEAAANNLRSRRAAITHARRGAGMALNAVLVALAVEPEDELRWGRSYIDHLRAIASADDARRHPLPAHTRALAARLLTIAVAPTAALVQLGRGPDSAAQEALELARSLLEACAAVVTARGE